MSERSEQRTAPPLHVVDVLRLQENPFQCQHLRKTRAMGRANGNRRILPTESRADGRWRDRSIECILMQN